MPLPLPFPDPAQDFVYCHIQDPAQQNHVIRETVAKRMGSIWNHVVHYVYSEIPGFSKENRSSGVYWFQYPKLPIFRNLGTHLFAEFAPTKKFYPLIGMPVPKPGQFQREKGLSLRVSLSPPDPDLPKAGSLDIRLFIERAIPVKFLLACLEPTQK